MRKKAIALLAVLAAWTLGFAALSEAQKMDSNQGLSPKQQGMVTIAAFTANGGIDKLKTALHAGLDAGLTVNEVKEIRVQPG